MRSTPKSLHGLSLRLLALAAAAVVSVGLVGQAGALGVPEDYPDESVEFVVPYAPGGGSDIFSRTLASMLVEEGIVDGDFNVVNREGGSGTIGQTYVIGQEGDNFILMPVTSGLLTNPLTIGTDVTYDDFTPIARMALDQLLIVVPEDSPFQTIEDLIEAAAAEPDEISWGGTGLGSEDSMVLAMLEEESEAELNYISHESGGEVLTALLGGHVDVASANPTEVIGQLESGDLRALAVAGEERLEDLPDVPTLTEKGYDVVFEQLRGIVGPPDMDPEVAQFWADALQALSETEAWQTEYIDANMMRSGFLATDEFETFLEEEGEKLAKLIEGMGLEAE